MLYTYSVSTDTLNNAVDADALKKEISESAISCSVSSVVVTADVLDITMAATLTTLEKTVLDGVVAAHSGDPFFVPDKLKDVFSVGPVAINSLAFVDAQTLTVKMEGGANYLLLISFEVTNGSAGKRDYSARILLNGSQVGATIPAKLANGTNGDEQLVVSWPFPVQGIPQGNHEWKLQIKSDSTLETQKLDNIRMMLAKLG